MENVQNVINYEYEGVDYQLGFTANSLKQMEKNGFNFAEMDKHIITAPIELFCGAFIAYHPRTPMKKREEIYYSLKEKEEGQENGQSLTEALGALLTETIEAMTSHKKGNVPWVVRPYTPSK